jgi:hypothetical protein
MEGWRVCSYTIASLYFCNSTWIPDVPWTWTTSMTTYRRKCTTTSSRVSWETLEISNLSPPQLQYIEPSDLFKVLNNTLALASNKSVEIQNTAQYQLAHYLFDFLVLSSNTYAQLSDQPLLYLRNLLTFPLYLCNPVILTNNTSITTAQTQLPLENQLLGSDAIGFVRAIPSRWTVYTYIATAGAIIAIVFIVIISQTSRVKVPNTSPFPLVDFLTLTSLEWRDLKSARESRAKDVRHDDVFESMPAKRSDRDYLERAREICVIPKRTTDKSVSIVSEQQVTISRHKTV